MLVSYLSIHKHYVVFMEMVTIVSCELVCVRALAHLALVYPFCLLNGTLSYE